jgi:hypothetical protein
MRPHCIQIPINKTKVKKPAKQKQKENKTKLKHKNKNNKITQKVKETRTRDNVRKFQLCYVLNCLRLSEGMAAQLWSSWPRYYNRQFEISVYETLE